ncbi:uncharacterized protein [Acropora muricata]|uniref:uncharacterized protein LOC114947512 n=1 Tax=Acropora millepora TaxID=45264 RepID=UPI001CF550FE|nr:uncharacterized protein LOC114947512 [Acropora millepora]
MEAASSVSLEAAKSSFLSLLSGVDPSEAGEFVDWVLQSCSGFHTNGDIALHIPETCPTQKEKKLKKIIKDIKKRVPLNAILMSEKIYSPEGKNSDCDPSRTVHIDSFLYTDEDIDQLCDEGKLSRFYCKKCGSHNTAPLTFISHSSSLLQLRFIFEAALPELHNNFDKSCLVDVGSRLGAVLYGAYHFSRIRKIVGVEINSDLCELQQEMIERHNMSDRVEVRCTDICNELKLLKGADIVVLNNVFEFFLPPQEQIRTWRVLRKALSKPGCILVTIPSLEEATIFNNEPCVDLEKWVTPCTVDYSVPAISSCDEDVQEFQSISFYLVK